MSFEIMDEKSFEMELNPLYDLDYFSIEGKSPDLQYEEGKLEIDNAKDNGNSSDKEKLSDSKNEEEGKEAGGMWTPGDETRMAHETRMGKMYAYDFFEFFLEPTLELENEGDPKNRVNYVSECAVKSSRRKLLPLSKVDKEIVNYFFKDRTAKKQKNLYIAVLKWIIFPPHPILRTLSRLSHDLLKQKRNKEHDIYTDWVFSQLCLRTGTKYCFSKNALEDELDGLTESRQVGLRMNFLRTFCTFKDNEEKKPVARPRSMILRKERPSNNLIVKGKKTSGHPDQGARWNNLSSTNPEADIEYWC